MKEFFFGKESKFLTTDISNENPTLQSYSIVRSSNAINKDFSTVLSI